MADLVFSGTQQFAGLFLQTLPLRGPGMRDAQVIKDAENQVIDERFDGLGSMIKARAGRNNMRTRMGQP